MKRGLICLSAFSCLLLGAGSVSADDTAIRLDEVKIEAKEFQESEGGIASGFLNKDVKVGPLGDKKAIDVPYQINTIPQEIIRNQRSRGLEDVVKYVPSAQIEYRGGGELGRPQTRGMRGGIVDNTLWDGFNVVSTTATPMAIFDNLQIHNGLGGALYGAQNPAGIYNFTFKRPTDDFENSAIFTYAEKKNTGIDLDFGGKTRLVGYRTNFSLNDGEGYVTNSNTRRKLASAGIDFYLTDRITLETNLVYYHYVKTGYAGQFNMGISPTTGAAQYDLPDAFDASKSKYGEKGGGADLRTRTASGKLKYDISDNWYAEVGYLKQSADRHMFVTVNAFNDNDGNFAQTTPARRGYTRFVVDSWLANLSTQQTLFGMEHSLSLGYRGFIHKHEALVPNSGSSRYKSFENETNTITLADTIKFNQQWQTLLSVGKSWINNGTYNATGSKTNDVSGDGESYAASLIYKPLETVSIYVTYADSIQAGATGTNSDTTPVVLSPTRSKQYELGTKFMLDYVDISAAVFHLERPIAYTGGDGIFREQGDQTNIGAELMVAGKLSSNLSVFGGVTYIDSELSGTRVPGTNKKQVIGVPEWQGNLLFEYTVPTFEELALSTNIHYTGKRAVDQANTQWADEYYTLDLGVRYANKELLGDRTILRVSLNNVTNEKYWAGIFAANGLDGVVQGGSTLFLGEPRTLTASVEVKF